MSLEKNKYPGINCKLLKIYPGVHVDFTIFCLIFDGEKQPPFLFLGSGSTWNLNLNFQWRKSNPVFKYYHSSATKSIFWLNSSTLDCLRSRAIDIAIKWLIVSQVCLLMIAHFTVGLTRTAHVTNSKKPRFVLTSLQGQQTLILTVW